MWVPDIWSNASLLAGAVVAVAASPLQAADKYVLGVCRVAKSDSGAEIRPAIGGDSYLYTYRNSVLPYKGFSFDSGHAKVTLVKAPMHGAVSHVNSRVSNYYYHYIPKEGFVGQDRFVMQVEKDGVKVRIHYLMEVVLEDEPTTYIGDDYERHDVYCKPDSWKISSTVTTPATDIASLQTLLEASDTTRTIFVMFAPLPPATLGQTTGTTITLDTNAAGHG